MLEVHDLTVSVFCCCCCCFFQLFSRRAQTALHFCKNNNNKKTCQFIYLQFRDGHLQVKISTAEPHSCCTIPADDWPVEGQCCPSNRAPVCVWLSFSAPPVRVWVRNYQQISQIERMIALTHEGSFSLFFLTRLTGVV